MFKSTFFAVTALAGLSTFKPVASQSCSGANNDTAPAHDAPAVCPLVFDSRIPANMSLADFDANNAFFGPNFVRGSENFSEIIKFVTSPPPSLFDQAVGTKPFIITINDQSIFAPSADNVQVGFRRAELSAASNSGTDNSTLGIKTLHFSLAKDVERPLNLTHEYQLVFLEDAAFSTGQFVLKTGTVPGVDGIDADALTLYGNTNTFGTVLFTTAFTPDTFHNFGLALDFNANTLQVFYSTGTESLQQATEPLANDLSGQGQYHFGILKKGFGGDGNPRAGSQPTGIDEGIVFAGIFNEDSSAGCRSVS